MVITQRELLQVDERQNVKVKTWHNGRYGLWRWSDLTKQEQRAHEQAKRRADYIVLFDPDGINSL